MNGELTKLRYALISTINHVIKAYIGQMMKVYD